MDQAFDNILQTLEDFKKTPESRGLDLRLDLAEIIIRNLNARGWSQRKLAAASGMKESQLSRVIHSNANCTLDTVGRILFALDARARLEEVECSDSFSFRYIDETGQESDFTINSQACTHGKEIQTSVETAQDRQIPHYREIAEER